MNAKSAGGNLFWTMPAWSIGQTFRSGCGIGGRSSRASEPRIPLLCERQELKYCRNEKDKRHTPSNAVQSALIHRKKSKYKRGADKADAGQ
jgi:hypothetical protein